MAVVHEKRMTIDRAQYEKVGAWYEVGRRSSGEATGVVQHVGYPSR